MSAIQHPVTGFEWESATDLSSSEQRARLTRAALTAFFRITKLWQLRDEDARQLLGGISNGGFYARKKRKEGALSQDVLTRISLLIGIFKALNILYSEKLADAWVKLPNQNPMFAGEAPLEYMVRGGLPAILQVRQLLDARRGGR